MLLFYLVRWVFDTWVYFENQRIAYVIALQYSLKYFKADFIVTYAINITSYSAMTLAFSQLPHTQWRCRSWFMWTCSTVKHFRQYCEMSDWSLLMHVHTSACTGTGCTMPDNNIPMTNRNWFCKLFWCSWLFLLSQDYCNTRKWRNKGNFVDVHCSW